MSDLRIDIDAGYFEDEEEEDELPICENCGADLHGATARERCLCYICFATRELEDEEYDPGDHNEA